MAPAFSTVPGSPSFPLPHAAEAALDLLTRAHEYARQLRRPVWDFALEIEAFWYAGLTSNDLRWLVCQGYAEHGIERTAPGHEHRAFRKARHLRLDRRSCFVLTEAGAALTARGHPRPAFRAWPEKADGDHPPGPQAGQPRWDADLRELWLGRELVKQFTRPARNQELILAAFQEEGWPARIDDPLPCHPDRDPVQCLHDAINRLNRHQNRPLLRFHGDGSGRGVRWGVTH
jgi:hypothetical protein